ncbi:MAG: hypothetical protein WD576_03355 [Nitriliruptoraceae bacterium]
MALMLLAAGGVYAMLSLGTESDPRDDTAGEESTSGDGGTGEADGPDDATNDDDSSSSPDDTAPGDADSNEPGELADRPDAPIPNEHRIDAPETADLAGDDAVQVALFVEIDASERAMMAFQSEVQDAFAQSRDLELVRDLVGDAADRGLRRLDVLRERMLSSAVYPGELSPSAADVRDSYIVHLDSWVDYLVVISDNPDLIMGDTTPYTIMINVTGDAFVREVARMIDEGMQADVQRYVDAIVDRGFSGPSDSQV